MITFKSFLFESKQLSKVVLEKNIIVKWFNSTYDHTRSIWLDTLRIMLDPHYFKMEILEYD